jgi:hypothetical protein
MREPRPSRGSNSPGPTTRVPSDDDGAVTGGNEDHHLDPFARLDVDMVKAFIRDRSTSRS